MIPHRRIEQGIITLLEASVAAREAVILVANKVPLLCSAVLALHGMQNSVV